MTTNLEYVNRLWDRYGKLSHYSRRAGQKAVPLPGKPGSPEFLKVYATALAAAERRAK
jgi:hypothetical protein